jgi:hypothetical protein
LILLCLSGSAQAQAQADDVWPISVWARAREPQLVYTVSYNACRASAHWVNDEQGCIQWLRGRIAGNLLVPWPIGSIPLDPEEIIYFVPVCQNQVEWKNAVYDRTTRAIHRKEVGCRP